MKIYDQNIWGNYPTGHCIGNRNVLIKELIEEFVPDVCCFQECNPQTSRSGETAIQKILQPLYVEVLPEYSNKNFTPVFYNTEKVELLDGDYFPFEGLNDIDSKSVTWGLFREKKSNKKIVVASVHFWWKASCEADNMQRLENAQAVVGLGKKLYKKYNAPFVVSGDLNNGIGAPQGTSAYEKMIELGMKDVRFIAKETDYAHTCSNSYPTPDEDGVYSGGVQPTYTLDHLFVYSEENLEVSKFSVINTQKARNSSDHSPILTELAL